MMASFQPESNFEGGYNDIRTFSKTGNYPFFPLSTTGRKPQKTILNRERPLFYPLESNGEQSW
jgi:hypothetical protein